MRVVNGECLDDGVDESGTWEKCNECGSTDELFFDDDGDLVCSDCIFENITMEEEE